MHSSKLKYDKLMLSKIEDSAVAFNLKMNTEYCNTISACKEFQNIQTVHLKNIMQMSNETNHFRSYETLNNE